MFINAESIRSIYIQPIIWLLLAMGCLWLLRTPEYDVLSIHHNEPTVTMIIDPIELQSISNFLTPDECEELIRYTDEKYEPSFVVNGTELIYSNLRTSSSAILLPEETELVASIESRVAAFANVSINQLELLQTIRYTETEEIKAHHDYYNVEHAKRVNNQRLYTMLIYLNTVDTQWGGATHFVYFNKSFQPVRGTALFWRNAFSMYDVDTLTLHVGQPVQQEQKYVMSVWLKLNPDSIRLSIGSTS